MPNQMLVTAVAAAMLAGCGAEPEPPSPEPEASMPEAAPSVPTPDLPPAMIVAERGGFIPEGVEYDTTNGRILVGSPLSEGSIFHIHNDGQVTTVVSDPDLVSSVGIEVDEPRNRLLVANSDRSVFQGRNGRAAFPHPAPRCRLQRSKRTRGYGLTDVWYREPAGTVSSACAPSARVAHVGTSRATRAARRGCRKAAMELGRSSGPRSSGYARERPSADTGLAREAGDAGGAGVRAEAPGA